MVPNPGAAQSVSLNGNALHNENLQSGQTPIVPPVQEPTPVINGRVVAVDMNIVNDDYMLASQGSGQSENKSPKDNKVNRTGIYSRF
mgnify:CR=1 FL=1